MKRTLLSIAVSMLFVVMSQTIAVAQPAAAQPSTAQPPAPGGRAMGGAPPRGRGFGGPIQIGPPAPVPPQVVILRPTADELAQIREAWKKFADADASSVKPLLDKYASVLIVDGPRANTAATYTQTFVRGPRHQAFVDIAAKGDIDLLLEGDSITDWWVQNDANKAMFDKYFGNIKTANFAVAGDTTQGVLWGLKNGEGQGFSPKAIMLMIGTNNMGSNTPPEIAEGIGAVVMELRKDFPDAKILLLAIFPRSTPGDAIRDRIAETNKIISRLDDQQHVFYMDIGPKFLDETGAFLPDSFRGDNLHPQAAGYDIWGAAVKEKLDNLMK